MARKRYTYEFRLNAARLVVEEGYSCSKALERLGVSDQSLRNWIHQFRTTGELPPEGEKVPVELGVKSLPLTIDVNGSRCWVLSSDIFTLLGSLIV